MFICCISPVLYLASKDLKYSISFAIFGCDINVIPVSFWYRYFIPFVYRIFVTDWQCGAKDQLKSIELLLNTMGQVLPSLMALRFPGQVCSKRDTTHLIVLLSRQSLRGT